MIAEELSYRKATINDLPRIIDLLSQDRLGAGRENPNDFESYRQIFKEIGSNPNHFLMVVEIKDFIVATCHLTILPYLSHCGARRLQIESLHVSEQIRSQGVGKWVLDQAIHWGKQYGAKKVQLTTNRTRLDSHRFYERFGFTPSHFGMKLSIDDKL